MSTVVVSSFEIRAETFFPDVGLAAEPPFVLQGYALYVSLPSSFGIRSIDFSLNFEETTGFAMPEDVPYALQALYVDANGRVQVYDAFLSNAPTGFANFRIAAGQTIGFEVRARPTTEPNVPLSAQHAIDRGGLRWRGTTTLVSEIGELVATPSQHRVAFGRQTAPADVLSAASHPVPTASGSTTFTF